jgi:hypothetical protein
MRLFYHSHYAWHFMAKAGDTVFAKWAEVEADGRLRLPTEITSRLSWYTPGVELEVLIELCEKGSLLIHAGTRIAEVEEQRSQLLRDFEGLEGPRRVALTYSFFFAGRFGKSNRQIVLRSSALAHLGIAKPNRVLCLVYVDRIEVLSEAKYEELSKIIRLDVVLETP